MVRKVIKYLFLLFVYLLDTTSLNAQAVVGQSDPNTWDASKYSGADICAKITNAAIAAKVLSPNGATIDARNITSGATCANPLYTGWPYPFSATIVLGTVIPSSIGTPPSNVYLVYSTPGTGTSSPVTFFNTDMSLSMTGDVLGQSGQLCTPAAGNYNIAYRNSVATNCTARSSDDFAILIFTDTAISDVWTFPKSSVTTFSGSITGNILTTPSNAVSIGSVITGLGVLDNTYVVSGGPTAWTINYTYTQPIGSETLTQSVYPPGHGTCIKHNGTKPLTVTATTSTIYGAAGVVNGNPAATGGAVVLFPQGEACFQADNSNNYLVSNFIPGVWYQGAAAGSSVSSFVWTGLSGYPRYHLGCSGVGSITTSGQMRIQLAYGGVFQTSGYTYQGWYGLQTASAMAVFSSASDTAFVISGFLPVNVNHEATLDVNLSFAFGTGMGYSNDMYSILRQNDNGGGGEERVDVSGEAPLTTTQPVTGIQLFPAAGTIYGMCWLSPRVGGG